MTSLPSPPASPVVILIGKATLSPGALEALKHALGCRIERAASYCPLFGDQRITTHGCLVIDVSQVGSGELFLPRWRRNLPIICLTDAGDVSLSVRAMKAGALDVLTKPVRRALLIDAVRLALNHSEQVLRQETETNELRKRYSSLSRREREVMALVASGLLNRQVAAHLCISEVTVKAHRGGVMRKMKAASLAGLVIMADRLQLMRGEQFVPSAANTPPSPCRAERYDSRCMSL